MVKIVGLQRSIGDRPYGYPFAHASLWGNLLDATVETGYAKWNKEDKVYFYLGSDYDGGEMLNFFGGLTEGLFERLDHFVNTDAEYYSLGYVLPDISKRVEKSINNPSTYSGFTPEFNEKLHKKCLSVKPILIKDIITDKLCIGDSHSISVTDFKSPVHKMIGKTLHGILKDDGLITEIEKLEVPDNTEITLMFGSIDIRHHLCRLDSPKESLKEMLTDYSKQVNKLSEKYKMIVFCPVPVESESRKLPKTGFYKGTPFYGSREERMELTDMFIKHITELVNNNVKVMTYPVNWYQMDPIVYEKTIMERPTNTHVAWPYSRSNNFGLKQNLEEW